MLSDEDKEFKQGKFMGNMSFCRNKKKKKLEMERGGRRDEEEEEVY